MGGHISLGAGSRLAHRGRCRLLRLLHLAAALHQQGMSFSILCSLGFVGLHLSLTAVLLGGSETCRTAVNCNYRCEPKTTRRRLTGMSEAASSRGLGAVLPQRRDRRNLFVDVVAADINVMICGRRVVRVF
jgi:hypothetical protein